jgi:hypothetical protein
MEVNGMSIEAMKQALGALENAEAEKQEPVAWQWLTTAHFRKKLPKDAERGAWNPLYTTPPAAQRQLLTDAEVLHLWAGDTPRPVLGKNKVLAFARAIEAAHGITGEKK